MKVYTKKGDQGETTLVDGRSISKGHDRLETYGSVDELNSHLGCLISMLEKEAKLTSLQPELLLVQNWLFQLGSQLACDNSEFAKKLPTITDENILTLEKSIDAFDQELPTLKKFYIAGRSLGLSPSPSVPNRSSQSRALLCQTQHDLPP